MSAFFSLIKMNIKLLLRNKMFLFFLCFAPIVSMIILGLKFDKTTRTIESIRGQILELEEPSRQVVYLADYSAFCIKVYDGSKSELSEYVLEELTKSGMFAVCRADVTDYTEDEVRAFAKKDAFRDAAGVLLYLKPEFDENIFAGEYENAVEIFVVSDDERMELFENEFGVLLSEINQLSNLFGEDASKICETLQTVNEKMPKKKVVTFSGEDNVALSGEQSSKRDLIGYAFAIITLGFLFCGVCVAHTVIEEQQNKAYTRIMLSGIGRGTYLAAKLVMAIAIALLQTLILGVGIFVCKDMDFGMSKLTFLGIIFMLGLIFATLSLCVGVVLGDIMGANYTVFTIWSISGLLGGLYFPLDFTAPTLKALSYLMPQRWFIRACEMIFVGDNSAYSMILYITVAYLVVIMSFGGIGLKIKHQES